MELAWNLNVVIAVFSGLAKTVALTTKSTDPAFGTLMEILSNLKTYFVTNVDSIKLSFIAEMLLINVPLAYNSKVENVFHGWIEVPANSTSTLLRAMSEFLAFTVVAKTAF